MVEGAAVEHGPAVRRVLRGDLARGRSWSHLQVKALTATTKDVAVDGGRRFGKSVVGAGKFTARIHQRIRRLAELVRSGKRRAWAGIGLPPDKARHEAPDVEAWVVTPRERHLEQCRIYLRSYYTGAFSRFLHPKLALCDGGAQMWLLVSGVAVQIRFVVGSSVASMVSRDIDELWLDEAGLLEGSVVDAIEPSLWARHGRRVLTGTPSLGTEHFFTRLILSGLDPSHPFFQPDIVEPSTEVTTVIGRSYDAFLPEVRDRARIDARRLGEAWERQWVLGDWRLPDIFVYDNWDPRAHVVDYDPQTHRLAGRQLPQPSAVLGVIDWAYSATKPGAAVVFHVWFRNPLDREDRTRPLVVAVEDAQEAQEYTSGGWYQTFAELRAAHGVQSWYADPSRDELIAQARRHAARIGFTRPADKADKWGRILMVKALLHRDPRTSTEPAFYVAREGCRHLPRQFAAFRRKLDARKNPTDKLIDYDDHCLDCVAFLVGIVMRGGQAVPSLSL